MFNASFNLMDFINDVPSLEVKAALYGSMRDSLNFRLVNAANQVCEVIEAEGFDIRDFNVGDVEKFLLGADIGDDSVLRELRAQMSLRGLLEDLAKHNAAATFSAPRKTLRDKLRKDKSEYEYGSLASAIESSCGVQQLRIKVDAGAEAALAAAGIKTTDADRMADAVKTRDTFQRLANEKAKRKGHIEWVLDRVLNAESADTFSELSVEERESMVSKISGKLNQLVNVAASNVRTGAKGLGLGDILIIKDEQARLLREAYTTPGQAEPKVVQADAPGPKARRVKKEATA